MPRRAAVRRHLAPLRGWAWRREVPGEDRGVLRPCLRVRRDLRLMNRALGGGGREIVGHRVTDIFHTRAATAGFPARGKFVPFYILTFSERSRLPPGWFAF